MVFRLFMNTFVKIFVRAQIELLCQREAPWENWQFSVQWPGTAWTGTILYILRSFKTSDDAFRLSYSISFDCSIRPFLDLFYSWLYIFHVSRFSRDGLVFSLPSVFQWIIIFGSRVGSILSTLTIPNKLFPGYVIQYHILRVHFFSSDILITGTIFLLQKGTKCFNNISVARNKVRFIGS